MSQKTRKVLVPSYMKQFACIGSACEDTCCIGWRVDIDEATYKKYRKVGKSDVKEALDKYVKRNRSNPNEMRYAKIVMQQGNCPLLTEEKLCSVQVNLGEDYLSNTCAVYPRYSNTVNEGLEQSLTLSCPEAARLVLLQQEGIEFEEIDQPAEARHTIKWNINTTNKLNSNKTDRYFWEMRFFTIQVLQNREYSLADRLIMLGMFYQKAQQYIQDGRTADVPQLIGSFLNMIETGELKQSLADIPTSTAIQMQLLKEVADYRVVQGVGNARYMECFSEVLHGIEYTDEATVEEIAARYQEGYTNYYAGFMSEHEYVLENYLVNYVFKNVFPHTSSGNVFEAYIMLVVHYSLIKLHLIGMAAFHKENFSLDHVLKLVQSFAKVVEHNSLYLMKVYQLLEKNGYNTMAYMAIMIKN